MLPAIETALIGALDAPLAPVWVWLCFAETPSGETLIGGARCCLPLFDNMMINREKRHPPKAISMRCLPRGTIILATSLFYHVPTPAFGAKHLITLIGYCQSVFQFDKSTRWVEHCCFNRQHHTGL